MTETPVEVTKPAPDPEGLRAQEVPALYVNRFYISTSEVVRIAFGEIAAGEEATYRTAVVMRPADAAALMEFLQKLFVPTPTEGAPTANTN